MGDWISRLRRFTVLVVITALHFALVTLLVFGSRIRLRSPVAQTVTTTMVPLRRTPEPPAPGPASKLSVAPLVSFAPVVPEPPSIAYPPANEPQNIDWQAEAHKAAAAITGSKEAPSESEDRRKTSSSHGPRPWFPPPAHHAGEQYTTITGDTIVWVSDKCYVESFAPIAGLPELFARQMLTTTVCPRTSGTARGDLFEALPAYKKLHPAPAPAK